jgi:hypothetical protein
MTALSLKPLALFILGIMIFIFIIYWGLNIAEKGICHILALEGPSQAMQFEITDKGISIIFGGKRYGVRLALLHIFRFVPSCWLYQQYRHY